MAIDKLLATMRNHPHTVREVISLELAGRRAAMLANDVRVMLAHRAWADGSSWAKVIGPLAAESTKVVAWLPLTSFGDDVAALKRILARLRGLLFVIVTVPASSWNPFLRPCARDKSPCVRQTTTLGK
jgi:hypothetical protein